VQYRLQISAAEQSLPADAKSRAAEEYVHGGCAAVNRGADYVEHLAPALRAGTRYSTGHREPYNQTAFARTAHGAGQRRD